MVTSAQQKRARQSASTSPLSSTFRYGGANININGSENLRQTSPGSSLYLNYDSGLDQAAMDSFITDPLRPAAGSTAIGAGRGGGSYVGSTARWGNNTGITGVGGSGATFSGASTSRPSPAATPAPSSPSGSGTGSGTNIEALLAQQQASLQAQQQALTANFQQQLNAANQAAAERESYFQQLQQLQDQQSAQVQAEQQRRALQEQEEQRRAALLLQRSMTDNQARRSAFRY